MAEEPVFDSRKSNTIFSSANIGAGFHAASYPLGTDSIFADVKWRIHEDNHSPLSRGKFKKSVKVYVQPPICLHDMMFN